MLSFVIQYMIYFWRKWLESFPRIQKNPIAEGTSGRSSLKGLAKASKAKFGKAQIIQTAQSESFHFSEHTPRSIRIRHRALETVSLHSTRP